MLYLFKKALIVNLKQLLDNNDPLEKVFGGLIDDMLKKYLITLIMPSESFSFSFIIPRNACNSKFRIK